MELLGITGVAAITIICYLVGSLVKCTTLDNKFIPVICGAFGGALGVVGMITIPDFPATDYITAIAVGIVSGLAATGINQAVKQLSERKKDKKMSNSKLVAYTKISPNKNPRKNSTYNPTGKITKITIHHMAGNLSVESCGNVFQTREASANYGIDSNGRVGMYVEEKDRSWASSSRENDYKAVTIEVANDGGADTDWHVSDKALAKLIDLCVDICQRNGIDRLTYTGDSKGNLTRHNMFAATTCPGPYLQGKFPYIAEEVNKRLGADKPLVPGEEVVEGSFFPARAFEKLDNAKAMADKNKGYAVFDESGKQVYPAGTATEKLYRVRKSWSDEASQKGSVSKTLPMRRRWQMNTGYTVYDWNGKAGLYTEEDL